jgi:fucose 4-O-acetylase-like acetyltransferase
MIMRKFPEKLRLPGIAACAGISYILCLSEFPRLPWNSATALMAVSFLWIGWYLQNRGISSKISQRKTAVVLGAILMVLTPLLIANGTHVGMNENHYGNLVLFFISGVGYSLVVVLLSHKISHISFFSNFLGQNTMVVIGFNYFARHATMEIYYMIPGVRNIPINSVSLFGGTCLILVCLIFGWNWIKSKKERM